MSRQLNLANSITIARILLIPVFLVLLLGGLPEPYGDIAAAAVFILAAATDKLDGYVARRSKQITTLGQFLDPLADKLLIAAALIALVSQDRVSAWVAMLIIGREVAVSVLRIVGVSQGVSIPADKYGKLKTVLQIIYVVYVIIPTDKIAEFINVSTDVVTVIQWILAGVVVVVTLASGVNYFLNARGLIRMPGTEAKPGDGDRAAEPGPSGGAGQPGASGSGPSDQPDDEW
jgi:CDP-diacylglycerol---glycerol-3-phosphate 3-phosphatidyltransferase